MNAANSLAEAIQAQSNLRLTGDLELAFLDHIFKIGAERPLTSLSAPDVKVQLTG